MENANDIQIFPELHQSLAFDCKNLKRAKYMHLMKS